MPREGAEPAAAGAGRGGQVDPADQCVGVGERVGEMLGQQQRWQGLGDQADGKPAEAAYLLAHVVGRGDDPLVPGGLAAGDGHAELFTT
jgi:hypothetical protein